MIRRAVPTDIHRLLEMGRAFFVETGWHEKADFDAESFAHTCGVLMDGAVILVAEKDGRAVAMAAAGACPAWWNRNVLCAQELFWYVDPAYRARQKIGTKLLVALEEAVKALGVHLFSMSAEEGLRSDALARLFRGRGYVPMERLFWRQLGGSA